MTPHYITAAMLVLCALVAIWVGWNEGEWTNDDRRKTQAPPLWLRHLVPWWLLQIWWDRRPGLCWNELVDWKEGVSDTRWASGECYSPIGCYCGKRQVDEESEEEEKGDAAK